MKTLEKLNNKAFPFKWVNLDYFPDSKGKKREIYLVDDENSLHGLILLFYSLFSSVKGGLEIYNASWWDYCMDTWDPKKNKYDYDLKGKSHETKDYLLLLQESSIEIGYVGSCICLDWDRFLHVSLQCLINHKAPYSPIIYDEKNNFFFYFHHSGSIGFYYKEDNEAVYKVLSLADAEYDVR